MNPQTPPTSPVARKSPDELVVGFVSISDRASSGTYQDEGIPALRDWFGKTLTTPWQSVERLIPDEQ
ncbi:MAG: molybdopterin adenylyltransferase, partial [Pseudomonadota bacterium]